MSFSVASDNVPYKIASKLGFDQRNVRAVRVVW